MLPPEILEAVASFSREKFTPSFQLISNDSLSGGCINHVHRITSSHGDFCLKFNQKASFPGMFECEAFGLNLLKESDTLRVPSVIHTGENGEYTYILLEFIASGKKISTFMEDFGHSLASMHLNSHDYFGLDHDNYMGSQPQSNVQHDQWINFFIEERLERQIAVARNSGHLVQEHIGSFQRLFARLERILPNEPPALLHGDLWNGNYMVSEEGKACLIDPAVYYGNREAELAMTTLFGGFDPAFYESYHETYPLQKGWKERLPLYQLYPLLIHLNIFGRSYLGSIEDILKKF